MGSAPQDGTHDAQQDDAHDPISEIVKARRRLRYFWKGQLWSFRVDLTIDTTLVPFQAPRRVSRTSTPETGMADFQAEVPVLTD